MRAGAIIPSLFLDLDMGLAIIYLDYTASALLQACSLEHSNHRAQAHSHSSSSFSSISKTKYGWFSRV
jgi:hypothetical protein